MLKSVRSSRLLHGMKVTFQCYCVKTINVSPSFTDVNITGQADHIAQRVGGPLTRTHARTHTHTHHVIMHTDTTIPIITKLLSCAQ